MALAQGTTLPRHRGNGRRRGPGSAPPESCGRDSDAAHMATRSSLPSSALHPCRRPRPLWRWGWLSHGHLLTLSSLSLSLSLVLLLHPSPAMAKRFSARRGTVALPLTHSLAHLPGSSFHQRLHGRHAMSAEHALLLRRITAARGRRLRGPKGPERPTSARGRGRRVQEGTVSGGFLPLQGHYDPQIQGLYWTELQLGQPAQTFKVQIDSGSNLIWVNCQPCASCGSPSPFNPAASATASPLQCSDGLCSAFQGAESQIPSGCLAAEPNDSKCYYWLVYGDGSSTTGYLLRDLMHFRQLDGSQGNMPVTVGCGYNQTGNLIQQGQAVDGLLGLGVGAVSLMVQMHRSSISNAVFAVCLGGESRGGGSLILGTELTPGSMHTPLYTPNTHYAVWLNGMSVGPTRLNGVDASSFGQQSGGEGQVILDTGTTLAIVPESVYNIFAAAIGASTTLKPSTDPDFFCFDFTGMRNADLSRYFPTVTLHFEGGDMVLQASNYMFAKDDGDRTRACLGWMPGQQTILGDIALHGLLVTFDVDQRVLGWAPFDCAGGTIQTAGGTYNVSIMVGVASNGAPSKLSRNWRWVHRLQLLPLAGWPWELLLLGLIVLGATL